MIRGGLARQGFQHSASIVLMDSALLLWAYFCPGVT